MKTSIRTIVIALFLIHLCPAQTPLPAWYANLLSFPAASSAPELAQIDRGMLGGGPISTGDVLIHGYMVWRYAEDGTLAALSNSSQCGIDTGLAKVWSLSVARVLTGTLPNQLFDEVGLVVAGLTANGVSRVLFGAWPEGAPASSVTFTPLIADAPPGEYYLFPEVVYGSLWVVEATHGEIRRYVDSDGDGLPDAISSDIPLDIAAHSDEGLWVVRGFYPYFGRVAVRCMFTDIRRRRVATIRSRNGALEFVREGDASHAGRRPMFVGHLAWTGLQRVRVAYEQGHVISIRDAATGNVLGKGVVAAPYRFAEVILKRPLVRNAVIKLKSETDGRESLPVTVLDAPKSLEVFSGFPYYASSGATVILTGTGFGSPTEPRVTVKGDLGAHGNFVALTSSVIDDARLAVSLPPLPPGTTVGQRTVLEITTTAGNVSRRHSMWVLPD